MKIILSIIISFVINFFYIDSAFSDVVVKSLPKCKISSNCVLVDWEVDNANSFYEMAIKFVEQTPRTKIIDQNNSYLHAEVYSRLMHYIDDLEIFKLPNGKIVQIRSASRVGTGDFGVNRKRVVNLLNQITKR